MTSSKTILVVDDEPRIVELARDYLEHAGFAVLTANDGPSALAAARTRQPDLVVLDLGLPGLDGLDVTRQLRTGERTAAVPIVIFSVRGLNPRQLAVRVGRRRARRPRLPSG